MKAFLISTGLFVCLLVALSFPVSVYIKNHFYTYGKQSWLLQKSNQSLDYGVLGSSRVFNMVDVKTLDSAWHKKGINLGTSGSCFAENFIILSEFTAKNKIAKLLLNVDEYSFDSQHHFSYPFHEYEFLNLAGHGYDSVFRDYIPAWKFYIWKALPVSKYMEFNNSFTIKKTADPELDIHKGTQLKGEFAQSNKADPASVKKRGQVILNAKDMTYFGKIIDLCHSKKIEIILITTPIYSPYSEQGNIIPEIITTYPAVAALPYVGFAGIFNYSDKNYFEDPAHTNTAGSLHYSALLGGELKNRNL